MKNSNSARRLFLASSIASAFMPTATRAQQSSTVEQLNDGELAAIVVTANRRQESILNVPVSISAETQESLDKQGIRNVGDLAALTPGLQFAPNGYAGGSQISVRGISSAIGAATTAIYIDDTPFQVRQLGAANAASSTYPPIFDLERIEVLRGPQGTLFGASAEGGAVRFITPQPGLTTYSAYSRGEVGFTRGGDPSTEIGAAGGGPIISDRLGFRVSAYDRRDGGWIDRVDPFTQNIVDRNSNLAETQTLSAALKYQVTDDFDVIAKIYHARITAHDANSAWSGLSDPREGRFHSGDAVGQPQDDLYTVYSLSANYKFASMEIVSETSYFGRRDRFTDDYTAVVPELLGLPYLLGAQTGALVPTAFTQGQQTLTEDLRLQSDGRGRLKWVAGLFFQNARQQLNENLPSPNADALTEAAYGLTVQQFFGVPALQPDNSLYLGQDTSRDKQYAVYGQVDYQIIDPLTLTAGARFAKDEFSATNAQFGPFAGGSSGAILGESDKPFTPKVAASYKPSEDLMFYASAAKGFRPGGGNTPVPANVCGTELAALGLSEAPHSYGPDYVWSYEVGAKGSVADHRVTYESSAFYINWKDIQTIVPLGGCGFTITENAAQAVSKGMDLNVTVLPLKGFTLNAAVGYTNSRFSKPLYGAPSATGDRALIISDGDRLLVHPWTLALHGDYSTRVSSQSMLMGYLHADFNWASGYSQYKPGSTVYDPLNNYIYSTHQTNLRMGVRTDSIDTSVFVNNVLDAHDTAFVSHGLGSGLFEDSYLRPRTIGITVTYHYK